MGCVISTGMHHVWLTNIISLVNMFSRRECSDGNVCFKKQALKRIFTVHFSNTKSEWVPLLEKRHFKLQYFIQTLYVFCAVSIPLRSLLEQDLIFAGDVVKFVLSLKRCVTIWWLDKSRYTKALALYTIYIFLNSPLYCICMAQLLSLIN